MIPRELRTSKQRPCPICGHGTWCHFHSDGGAVWCGRVPGGRPWRDGWIHRLDGTARLTPSPALATMEQRPRVLRDFARMACRFARQLTADRARRLADSLQLNVGSLRRLGAGWADAEQIRTQDTKCRGAGCWTFPTCDGAGRIVGIRLRTLEGFKYTIDGSDGSGLCLPRDLATGGLLIAPEGPTSCAALLVLGLRAAGRPNNRAGVDHLRALVTRLKTQRLIVLGDNDYRVGPRGPEWPGRDGAIATASRLRGTCSGGVLWAMPPPGIKDSREWLAAGATAAEVMERIQATTQGMDRHAG